MSVIELEEVWKVYRMGEVDVPALRGLSLSIREGEHVAIMGPSGSGKSTALNMVGCLDVPTRGRVLLEGRDISRMGESELARLRGRRIGFVFQLHNLYPSLNVVENIELPLRIHDFPEGEVVGRSRELLSLVGLEGRGGHMPSQLSGGERQRVAVARALAPRPAMVLADEPTGSLDSRTGEQILELFREVHGQGTTLVVVTHDSGVAARAQRVIRLRDGRVAEEAHAN
ncbi:MAG: ABC transporter ATP-binding protein [Euryarchaeota archaeon]|nr:ABC transporter ATP-binding protein [Euryarchaeota archaeon]